MKQPPALGLGRNQAFDHRQHEGNRWDTVSRDIGPVENQLGGPPHESCRVALEIQRHEALLCVEEKPRYLSDPELAVTELTRRGACCSRANFFGFGFRHGILRGGSLKQKAKHRPSMP